MDDADVKKVAVRTEDDTKVATAIVVPVFLAWLNPGAASGLGDEVGDDVDNVVMSNDGAVACFVCQAVPWVEAEVGATVAVAGDGGGDGKVEAKLCGGDVGLIVHWGGRVGVAEPSTSQRGTRGE